MPFDLTSAKPARTGFDLASARPFGKPVSGVGAIPLPSGGAESMAAEQAALQTPDTLGQRVLGVLEAPAAMATGALGTAAGGLAGIGRAITGGNFGTQEGIQQGAQAGADVSRALTYQPRTQTGRQLLSMAGEVAAPLEALGTLPSAQLAALARGAAPVTGRVRDMAAASGAQQNAADAAMAAGGGRLRDLVRAPAQPSMSGGGAAATSQAAQRAQRAESLGFKEKLTKGQLTRDPEQVQFERETAKTPEGKALNQRYAAQNREMQQKFESMADETGMQASGDYSAGRGIVGALEAKKSAKKAEISQAYAAARDSGDMAQPVDIQPIAAFVEKNRSAARNAPILSAIEDEVARLSGGTGKISVNDMEELRKMVGNLAQPGTPNAKYGADAVRLIDAATEGQGGPLYQQARRLFQNYSNEFTNRDVIDKLLRTKPGTKDRAVAYEDVFKNSILTASKDDVRHIFRTLQAHPANMAPDVVEAGQQAAKELRGAAVNHIKERAFGNAGADAAGNVVGSEIKLKRVINELDKDGRLEIIFGKKGAQEMRDIRDLATDLYTSPAGTVNSSNNANRIVQALDQFSKLTSGIPLAGPAAKFVAKRSESKATSKKVAAALDPKLSDLAGGN